MLNEKMIKKFEDAGFKRWTKGGYDRLYIDATACGLEYDTYKSGNISSATFNGESISNARAGRMKAMKMYVDIATGEFHAEHAYGTKGDAEIAAAAEAIYTAIVEAAEAEEAEGKAPKEGSMKRYDVDYQGGESRYGIEPVDYMLVKIDDIELYAEAPAQDDENANYDELKTAILEQAAEHDIPAERLKFWDEM